MPRSKNSRPAGKPVPEAIATDEARRLMDNYLRWTEHVGTDMRDPTKNQLIMVLQSQPPPPLKAEPEEMRMLLDLGWVKAGPGLYQRELEVPPMMVFDPNPRMYKAR